MDAHHQSMIDIWIPYKFEVISDSPFSSKRPWPQLLLRFRLITPDKLPALPLAAVLEQGLRVQGDAPAQRHHPDSSLHGPHQGPGLLSPQTLAKDTNHITFEKVNERATATDIPEIDTPRHIREQWG